jgi:hypothetical protein
MIKQFLSTMNHRRKMMRQLAPTSVEFMGAIGDIGAAQYLDGIKKSSIDRNPLLGFGAKSYSQNDEDGIIAEILARVIGRGEMGTFLEFGVGDGLENNTLNLLMSGWRGVWLGGESLRFGKIGSRLRFNRCWIDRDNAVTLARAELDVLAIDVPDLVSIDLDGNDWYVCQALLESGIRPAVFVVEYNAKLSPGSFWVMPYDPLNTWVGDDYFGASLGAFNRLMNSSGYRLVGCNITGSNAFYVQEEAVGKFPEIPEDCLAMYMAPTYIRYPMFGHVASTRLVEDVLAGDPSQRLVEAMERLAP